MDKLERAKAVIEALNTDYVTYDDATKLFNTLKDAVTKVKDSLDAQLSSTSSSVSSDLSKMKEDFARFQKGVDNAITLYQTSSDKKLKDALAQQLSDLSKLIPTIPEPVLFDPTELQNQIDVLMAYETPKLQATEARDALESLEGDERLDASAIKNLPEAVQEISKVYGGNGPLWGLADVDVAGIVVDQSIKWDGIKWVAYTPGSGGGSVTSVASADGSITVTNGTTTPDLAVVKAPKLTTGRTISISGDMTYTSPSFDGSGNVTAAGTLATVNSNVGSFTNANITVNAKGLITAASNGAGGGGSGITRSVNVISTPTTAGATAITDYVYLVSGTTTLTLPTAVGNTNQYTVKNTGSGDVTVATTASQTIDGGSTAVLTASLQDAINIISDGSNWFII